MATTYTYGNNTGWTDSGVTGACALQAQYGECLVHFGTTLPATYDEGKHIHMKPEDEMFRYTGAETIYVRAFNNNVAGIRQTCKIALTPLV